MRSLISRHRRRYARLALAASGLVLVLAFARPSERAPAALDWLDFPVLASDGAVLTVALVGLVAVVGACGALYRRRRREAPHPLEEQLLSRWLLLAIAGTFAIGGAFLVAWVNEGDGRLGVVIAAALALTSVLAIALALTEESFVFGGICLLGALFAGAGAAAGRAALGGDQLFTRRPWTPLYLPKAIAFVLVFGGGVFVAISLARWLLFDRRLAEPPIEHTLTSGAGRFELLIDLPAGLDPREAEATVVEGPRVRVSFRRFDGPGRRALYVVLPGPVEGGPVIEMTEDGVRVILVRAAG